MDTSKLPSAPPPPPPSPAEIKLTVFHPLDKANPQLKPRTDNDEEDEAEEEEDRKSVEYGDIEAPSDYPLVDGDAMDQFCQDAVKMSVKELQQEYSWTYASAICFWLRNNDRLVSEVYDPVIKASDWKKVKYLVDLLLPSASMLELLVGDTAPDCPEDVFTFCFDAVCRGEIRCPYCSTKDEPLTRNECEHTEMWQGVGRDEMYEEHTVADDIFHRASTECLTMHLNALLKRPPGAVTHLRDKCLTIFRNSNAEEYDAIVTRLFP